MTNTPCWALHLERSERFLPAGWGRRDPDGALTDTVVP